jgi:uncharacterized protein YfaS (alpha-2-macroglobulin family)
MTRPLDPSRSYADFVLVSPDLAHPPSASVRGDELCLAGLGFGPRRVTLLRGLPDRAGDVLLASADVDLFPGPGAPYVGFAGQGVILPRDESDGVGIETANVSRVAVEVWRVVDRNMVRKTLAAPSPTGEGEWPGDYGEYSPDDEGRRVWKGELRIPGDPAARATTVFPLGAVLRAMEPGAFVIKARDITAGRDPAPREGDDTGESRSAQARRWVMFTDMALTAYKGADGLDVVVRSLKTARVLTGVSLSVVARDGETLAAVKADASGRARFPAPLLAGQGALTPRMVMAHGAAGDLAVLDLARAPVDLSRQPVSGRASSAAVDGFLYSDRGVYRPGERAHLVALLRGLDARAIGDRKGAIIVKRPSGVEFRRYSFASAPGGGVSADVDLPATAPRGRWTAELRIEGLDDPAGALAFSVEDFTPRRLAVTLVGHPEAPIGAQPRAVDVSARFLYGAAGAGLQLQGEARLRTDPNPFPQYAGYEWGDAVKPFAEKLVELGSSVTDGEGRARLMLAAGMAGDTADPLSAALTASVFEPGGRPVREGLTLKVRARPLYLGVKVDRGEASDARTPLVTEEVIAVDAAGRRVAAPGVGWRLISEQWSYDWFQQDGCWQWRRSSREVAVAPGVLAVSAGGPARLSGRLGWGDYRLELLGADGARTVRRFSAGWGAPAGDAEAPDEARVGVSLANHRQGDTVEIAIKAPYAGEAQVAVATDRLIDFHTLTLGARGGVVRLKTSAAWGGGAYVLVSVIQPRDPVSTPVPRRALGLVYVPLDPGARRLTVDLAVPAKVYSKAPFVVPLRVRGLGQGQRARVTLAAVDEGILALTHFESPDPVAWYFGKRALGIDYRDDYGRIMDANLGAPANVNFGGDELGGQGLTATPTRTVALWSGVVTTGADGRARIRLPPGDFNGQLRVMAVAWTDYRRCARSAGPRGSPRCLIAWPIRAPGRLPTPPPPRRPRPAVDPGPRLMRYMSWPRRVRATCRACAGATTRSSPPSARP